MSSGHFAVLAQGTQPTQPAGSPEAAGTHETGSGEQPEGNPPPPPTAEVRTGFLSSYEFTITLIVTGIAVLALFMEFMLLRNTKNLKSEDILRVFGVTLIILGTLFFVTAGYDANHIAPAMGLFGTVAGYLLGRSTRKNEVSEGE